MLIDVHVHSHHSPGCLLAPRDIVRRAKETGLDGIVLTDTNTLDGLEEIRSAGREEGLLALCGVELVTDRGHYLCYFPDPSRVPTPPQMFGHTPWAVREVLDRVRSLGGVVVAAHPYDKSVERPSGDFIFTLEGICALEGLNARRRGPANDLAIEAADHMNLPCVGGSGALPTLDDIGKAATLFKEPVATEADLVRQLKSGQVFCVSIGAIPAAARASRQGERREARGGDRRGGRGHRRGGHDRR
ncbi:MAG TPA: PHP domain-containing protein [Anaeromyxobacteraceae bacterium]|nr:PHP domain-containing protein [Anaeromyxobacteraceae bacterium]